MRSSRDKAILMRNGIYAVILIAGVTAWLPYASQYYDGWSTKRRLHNTITLLYTTDTRGFLESCG